MFDGITFSSIESSGHNEMNSIKTIQHRIVRLIVK